MTNKIFKHEEWPAKWQQGDLEKQPAPGAFNPASLKEGAIRALCADDLDNKISHTRITAHKWFEGTIGLGGNISNTPPNRPGRPTKPNLVAPDNLRKRSIHTDKGRFALLHAIAHIELNAMDLAWDIVARFSMTSTATPNSHYKMPRSFYDGWVRVALEEAKHFTLLQERLNEMGGEYGDLDAHDGLWEAAQVTDHALTARLAVVPLILEARGLDITPALLKKMHAVGDEKSARIFEIIYRDEQGHVAVGAKWFRYLCLREGKEPAQAFQELVRKYFRGPLKPPFNDMARSRAGLTPGFYRALSSAGN